MNRSAGASAPRPLTQRLLTPQLITRTALVAGAYAAVTLALAPISYGPVQVRVAEAFTVLPFVSLPAVPGLFLGCLVANVLGGYGLADVIFGSLATLVAAVLTRATGRVGLPAWLAPLPPVVVNAIVVPAYLSALFQVPYWATAGQVLLGQAIACYGLGYPLLTLLRRREDLAGRLA